MNVVVCVKQIPDPNSLGLLDPVSHRLQREGIDVVLDPGDEYGVEAGLQLVEAAGGHVTIVSMGPERAADAVRKALAMGASKGSLASDPALAGADTLTTARVLAALIRREAFDLVITATESTDGYTGIVPQALAELLDLPAVTFTKAMHPADCGLRVTRQTEVGYETVMVDLPAVVSVTAGANTPRYPSLKGIMGARAKPLEILTLADLGLDGMTTDDRQRIREVEPVAERSRGDIIRDVGDGDRGDGVLCIVDFLAARKIISGGP